MKNKNIFKLLSLILLATFAFSILTTSAMGESKRKKVVASGVVSPTGDILFSLTDNFISMRIAQGVYLIEVDARLQCNHNGATQAAIGPRLATPVWNGSNVASGLFWVDSDVTGVCNRTAVYVVGVWLRGNNTPLDSAFSFQVAGIKDSKKDSEDDSEDD